MITRTKWIAGAWAAVVIVPCALYLSVNFYWWLFDGNVPNGDKMGAAAVVVFLGAFLGIVSCMASEDF